MLTDSKTDECKVLPERHVCVKVCFYLLEGPESMDLVRCLCVLGDLNLYLQLDWVFGPQALAGPDASS